MKEVLRRTFDIVTDLSKSRAEFIFIWMTALDARRGQINSGIQRKSVDSLRGRGVQFEMSQLNQNDIFSKKRCLTFPTDFFAYCERGIDNPVSVPVEGKDES